MPGIYRISQTANKDYDTYDSAIVLANSAEEARAMHPSGRSNYWTEDLGRWGRDWADKISDVKVEYIGQTSNLCETTSDPGDILCSSFNAG